MRWTRGGRSRYIEDRRGQRAGWGGRIGAGTVVLALVAFLAQRYLGVDLGLGNRSSAPTQTQAEPIDPANDPDREIIEFISFVIEDIHATWEREFEKVGKKYRPANLAVFRESTPTGCGYGSTAIGPFYCPADEKAFIDLSFFRLLRERFKAPGDFAQAYVLAHEIGHHVQNVLGYEDTMRAEQRRDPDRKNDLSVRFELQADCLAGVWGHSSQKRNLLEPGDVEEGMRAAAAIGDDTLQKQSGGRVSPESWTHGSSEQRMRWLRRGMETGSIAACETADADRL
jgi:predicted metalloprotease